MTDSLRTRIAQALQNMDDEIEITFETMADAVIAKLRPQLSAWAQTCVDSGDMTPAAQRALHDILGSKRD